MARQRREALEDKLQRAEMLRESHLQERIRRAQEEEAKVSSVSCLCNIMWSKCSIITSPKASIVTLSVYIVQVSEISFINTLEAQNRKIEVQERYQVSLAGCVGFPHCGLCMV